MPLRINGRVQHYEWGDPSFIPALLGVEPDGSPWAEWWLGTHLSGPSTVLHDHSEQPLSELVGDLPFLVKVLACNQPLSLQTHPTITQARQGFEREVRNEIPITAANRTYKDTSDKPELLIALTEFEALCGFKDLDQAVADINSYGWRDEADLLDMNGVDGYVLWAFDQRETPDLADAPEWLRNIAARWPNDPALRVAPLLNHVVLKPGEAICLPAGNLHAYLNGAGFEVMNNSDNVVRAGFTNKYVDKHELQRIVDTTPLEAPVVHAEEHHGVAVYPSPSDAWTVTRLSIDHAINIDEAMTPRILVITSGTCNVGEAGHAYVVEAGESLHLVGEGTAWLVGAPVQ